HCSTSQKMARVRQRIWIDKLRSLTRKIIRRCVPCQKMNSLPYKYPTMEGLPGRRVVRSHPFQHVGIDYFGPLTVKRDEDIRKIYGIIITCATIRLLHLKMMHNMSKNELLLVLRRFFARRGVPSTITSHNAANFSLGEQILRTAILQIIEDSMLAKTVATMGITWKTITPYAPWQEDERLIKSVKHSLYKVLQKKVPTEVELETLIVEIEESLNNTPLTYIEGEPGDPVILRPIDFI
ncbi:hypothetical protein Angca_000459, partial [Angiostrongylus cantonensis]